MAVHDPLNAPLKLPSGVTLPNRIAKAATSEVMATDGAPSDRLVRLYRRWGAGGSGLLISGNVIVRADGRTEPNNVVVEDGRDLPRLRYWAAAAQEQGAHLWMQINHAGRQVSRRISSEPVAPSAVPLKGFGGLFATPRPLADAEIWELISRFATAAAVAKEAGFRGVQIHAAHGYLLSQFLSPRVNLREDDWGGDPERRRRFLLEVVRATRAAVGDEFPVAVKLNSADFQRGGFSEEESMDVVTALEAEGIDLLEISGGNYEKSAMMGERDSTREREAYFLSYAEKVRARVGLPLLLTGGMRTAATMRKVVDSGTVDMIGIGRPLLVEPDLPRRILAGEAERAVEVDTRVGVRLFDDMLQLVWYQAQMRRVADGGDPDPALGKWRPLITGFLGNLMFNPFRALFERRRPRIASPRPAGS